MDSILALLLFLAQAHLEYKIKINKWLLSLYNMGKIGYAKCARILLQISQKNWHTQHFLHITRQSKFFSTVQGFHILILALIYIDSILALLHFGFWHMQIWTARLKSRSNLFLYTIWGRLIINMHHNSGANRTKNCHTFHVPHWLCILDTFCVPPDSFENCLEERWGSEY